MENIFSKTVNPQYNPADIRHLHDLTFLLQQFEVDDEFKKHVIKIVSSDIKRRVKDDVSYYTVVKYVIDELRNNKEFYSVCKQYLLCKNSRTT